MKSVRPSRSVPESGQYVGRFAPSPTGPLHLGSLVAAMASYLDARAHHGAWLVRVEDLDRDRNVAGIDQHILASLQRCGMQWDGDVTWQTRRTHLYDVALEQLVARGAAYPCSCSRKEIADSQLRQGQGATGAMGLQSSAGLVYPGTCRGGLAPGKAARAMRLRVPDAPNDEYCFDDRWVGVTCQHLATDVGDFVIRRADGFWAYQLAVVVDDAAQGVTDVVRGADLLDSTPRQLFLQEVLGLPHPEYLHVPVVANADGEKLSKQTGALAFDTGGDPQSLVASALAPAARFLGLEVRAGSIEAFWKAAIPAWAAMLER
jgi:glutamyl-Q tRNA(Asp) synthetase